MMECAREGERAREDLHVRFSWVTGLDWECSPSIEMR